MHAIAMDALLLLLVVATTMLGWTLVDVVVRRGAATDGDN